MWDSKRSVLASKNVLFIFMEVVFSVMKSVTAKTVIEVCPDTFVFHQLKQIL